MALLPIWPKLINFASAEVRGPLVIPKRTIAQISAAVCEMAH